MGALIFGSCSSSDYIERPNKESNGRQENIDNTAKSMEEVADYRKYLDSVINTFEKAGRVDLAISFAMYYGGINRIARIFEERGDYKSARYWANLGGDTDYVFRLYEKETNRFIIKGDPVSALPVIRKLGNSERAVKLKEKVLAALERNEKFAYAGDLALELGDKERAFGNYSSWEDTDPAQMKGLANNIALVAENKARNKTAEIKEKLAALEKAARYFEEAANLGDKSAASSAARIYMVVDDFAGARRNFATSGEIEWVKTDLAKHAISRINQLAEQGELYEALRISIEIGDESKQASIKSCIELEKSLDQKNHPK